MSGSVTIPQGATATIGLRFTNGSSVVACPSGGAISVVNSGTQPVVSASLNGGEVTMTALNQGSALINYTKPNTTPISISLAVTVADPVNVAFNLASLSIT